MEIKKLHILLLLTVTLPFLMSSQNSYNLDFDDFNPEEEVMPAGWFKWGDFETVTGEKTIDGNSVGKVVADKDGKFGCITYRIPANYVGDTIELSGRIKHENVKGFVGLLMRIDGNSRKKSLAFTSMQNLKITGTRDWEEYTIKLPFPTNAKSIYVGGILGKKGVAWFDDFKVTIDKKDIRTLKETKSLTLADYNPNKLSSAISNSLNQLDISNQETLSRSLDSLIAKIGNKKIVAIGENTHGTSEFYQLREMITKRLIKEKGFNLVILENPYDDIEILNRDLDATPLDTLIRKHLFSIYQTKEMKSFLQWYKDNRFNYNVEFKGCDDSYWTFNELLKNGTNPINDKKLGKLLKTLESNISKSSTNNRTQESKINYAIYNVIMTIENHLKSTNKLNKQLEEILSNGKNTYINYANIKNKKPFESRDEIMADRISFLAKTSDKKIIVWAHNAHISNEIITDNEIGIMGRDLKKEFGTDYYTIGLTTLNGNYSYMEEKFINGDHNYTEKLKTANFNPKEELFWEKVMAQNGDSFIVDMPTLKNELNTNELFGPTRLIGYSKETEDDFFFLPLIKDFDSLIFIKNTNATSPIFN